jgi:outer membrane receptor for monomeric catechols
MADYKKQSELAANPQFQAMCQVATADVINDVMGENPGAYGGASSQWYIKRQTFTNQVKSQLAVNVVNIVSKFAATQLQENFTIEPDGSLSYEVSANATLKNGIIAVWDNMSGVSYPDKNPA